MYLCIHTYVQYICIYIYMPIYIWIYLYTYVYVYRYIFMCICLRLRLCLCLCKYTIISYSCTYSTYAQSDFERIFQFRVTCFVFVRHVMSYQNSLTHARAFSPSFVFLSKSHRVWLTFFLVICTCDITYWCRKPVWHYFVVMN